MKFSIITVTYNNLKGLQRTVEEVFSQNNKDFELIIIDGKSKDGTQKYLEDLSVSIVAHKYEGITPTHLRYRSEPDHGIYDAMNKGLDLAQGEFVWYMNAGDAFFDFETLKLVARVMNRFPQSDVVYGRAVVMNQEGRILGGRHKLAPEILTKGSLLQGMVVSHQAVAVRRSVAPHYNLTYKLSADYDWICTALEHSKHNQYVGGYVAKFEVGGVSSRKRKDSWRERYTIMKRHFGLFLTLWAHVKIGLHYPFSHKV